jgi:hypothetical protein
MPAASLYAACEGLSQAGVKRNGGIGITGDLMDARSLFLTPNSTTVYVTMCIDLKDGPVVAEVPPGVLGPADDAYFRWVTGVGLTGPDAARAANTCSFRRGTPAPCRRRVISLQSRSPTATCCSIVPSSRVATSLLP